MRLRVFSIQTYRDTNYGVLNVQREVELVHKERNMRGSIFSLNCVHQVLHVMGTPGGYVEGFGAKCFSVWSFVVIVCWMIKLISPSIRLISGSTSGDSVRSTLSLISLVSKISERRSAAAIN